MEVLKRKIKVLGTELLMDTKKKVKELQNQEEQREKALVKKWQEKTEMKLEDLQRTYDLEIQHLEKKSTADFQLKEQLSLLDLKNKLFLEVKNEILNHIRHQIETNYSEYLSYIRTQIILNLEKLNANATLFLNEKDKKQFKLESLPQTTHKITLGDHTISTMGGFELETEDHSKTITLLLEDILEKGETLLRTEFNRQIQPDIV